jgi:Multidrug resistance efflux pump
MKRKIKVMILTSIIIILILCIPYYYFFVYGSHVSTDSLYDISVTVNGSIVSITADTAGSGNAFAGYDAVWVVNELQIRPRYSIVSKQNPNGKMEIVYDIKDRPLDKIFLVGFSEGDKKLIWPIE